MIDVHIHRFQAQAELLDAQGARSSLDDVIAQLAAWMSLASSRLTEDDMTVLTALGGSLYREGLRRRSL